MASSTIGPGRPAWRRAWGFAGALLLWLPVSLSACGGDGDGADGDSPAPGSGSPAATLAPDQTLLQQMVLTLDDVPAGMQQAAGSFTTNEEAAQGSADPEKAQAKFDAWGRKLGYRVTFLPSPGGSVDLRIGIESEANLYESAEGSGFSFSDDVARARATDVAGVSLLLDVQVTEVDAPDVGAERYWLRVSGFSPDNPDVLEISDQVVFRVEGIKGYLRVDGVFEGETDRDRYRNEVLQWARLMAERARAALDVLASAGAAEPPGQ